MKRQHFAAKQKETHLKFMMMKLTAMVYWFFYIELKAFLSLLLIQKTSFFTGSIKCSSSFPAFTHWLDWLRLRFAVVADGYVS